MAELPKAVDYRMTTDEAGVLAAAALLPVDIRRTLLQQHATKHGWPALVDLFAEFIGLANSVVANNRVMVEGILIEEGKMPPTEAAKANLPTIFGALMGVKLAARAPGCEGACGGCAFRVGTAANQSEITTIDADGCLEEGEGFFCHEDIPADGIATKTCIGFALARKAEKDRGGGSCR